MTQPNRESTKNLIDGFEADGYKPLWDAIGDAVNYAINEQRTTNVFTAAITLTDVIAGDRTDPLFSLIMRLGAVIVLFCFSFYVAAQFQAAGHAFASAFDINWRLSVMIGVLVVLAYTLLGGFWAVSVTDTVQALLMLVSSLLLPVIAVLSVGGLGQLFASLDTILSADQQSLTRGLGGALGIAFVVGTLGIGLGYPGQPHVVNRFMALRDARALSQARLIALPEAPARPVRPIRWT